jgi:LysM repeat protein
VSRAEFLRERDDLRTVPVEAPGATRLVIAPGASGEERRVARAWNEFGGLITSLCRITELDAASAVAVLAVESGGAAFAADGRLVIRFENHQFWKRWGRANKRLFDAHFEFDSSKTWTNHRFDNGSGWVACHASPTREWEVLTFARGLNENAALESISMGGPQIMGFNAAAIGYRSAAEMFAAFESDSTAHLLGLFDFIRGAGTTSPMLDALRSERWEQFASRYNGQGNAPHYGGLMANHVEAFRKLRAAPAPAAAAADGDGQQTYSVQRGDRLGAIARRFGVTLAELVLANGIAAPNRIFVNQLLRIPPSMPAPARVEAGEAEAPAVADGPRRVEARETLASLAADLGVTVAALVAANPEWQLVAGQIVTRPA